MYHSRGWYRYTLQVQVQTKYRPWYRVKVQSTGGTVPSPAEIYAKVFNQQPRVSLHAATKADLSVNVPKTTGLMEHPSVKQARAEFRAKIKTEELREIESVTPVRPANVTPERVPPTAEQRGKQVVVDEAKPKKKKVRFFTKAEREEFDEVVRSKLAKGYNPFDKIKNEP